MKSNPCKHSLKQSMGNFQINSENKSELGMGEDSGFGPFYVKNDSNTYIVFFGLGFDENYVYNSETKEWSHTR